MKYYAIGLFLLLLIPLTNLSAEIKLKITRNVPASMVISESSGPCVDSYNKDQNPLLITVKSNCRITFVKKGTSTPKVCAFIIAGDTIKVDNEDTTGQIYCSSSYPGPDKDQYWIVFVGGKN